MAYAKAVIGAFLAALLLGAGAGLWSVLTAAVSALPAEDRATVFGAGVSVAVNCTAFYALLLVPAAIVMMLAVRRWRRRSPPAGAPR